MGASTELARTGAGGLSSTGAQSVWDAYAAALDASPRTKRAYRAALRCYASWLNETGADLSACTRETIISYREALVAAGRKPATANAYLAAVRSFYAWAESVKAYPNIARGVRGVKVSAGTSKDALTEAEARAFIAQGEGAATLKDLRDQAICTLMVSRGLRTIEVSRADVGDLDRKGGKAVLWVQGKGRADKGEFVVLSADVAEPIRAYLSARGHVEPSDPLFASVSNRDRGGRMSTRSISRVCSERLQAMGVKSDRITAHSLRHTAVTTALLEGASVQDAQALARHSRIETTMIYAHNIDRLEARAERAIDRALFGEAA